MPRFDTDNMESYALSNSLMYSTTVMDQITANEYTIATLIIDKSGSVASYASQLEESVSIAVERLKKHVRAQYILLRVLYFNRVIEEIHGFKLLDSINPKDYSGTIHPAGSTNIYEAFGTSIEATEREAQRLIDAKEITTNAWIMVITDGYQNESSFFSPTSIKAKLEGMVTDEKVESVYSILVGVNSDASGITKALEDLKDEVGFTQYLSINDFINNKEALAGLIVVSLSSQSQSVNSGGPSKQITLADI